MLGMKNRESLDSIVLDEFENVSAQFRSLFLAEHQEDGTHLPDMTTVEGVWSPVITFAIPGDVAITYATRAGFYVKRGRLVVLTYLITTDTFTHTTATGELRISGIPFNPMDLFFIRWTGSMHFSGITKTNYTQFVPTLISGQTYLHVQASGSGVSGATVDAADMPTGGSVVLAGTITYQSV